MPDVLIQTYNEELNLPRTLESVAGWANKIFIVDSGSTDRTKAIADQAGTTFIYHAWEGYAGQKNWALDNLPWESDWILIVDADESVTPELRDEITAVTKKATSEVRESGFYLNRMLIFMGGKIRHCGYFPSWNLRLFKRGMARYEERLVHEHMIVSGPVGHLDHLLLHEDQRGLEHFHAKHNRYSTLEAREIYESPEQWNGIRQYLTDPIWRRRFIKTRVTPNLPMAWLWRFLYMYVLRLGFLDGRGGWQLCHSIASYELSIQLKVAELKRLHGTSGSRASGLSVPEGSGTFAESANFADVGEPVPDDNSVEPNKGAQVSRTTRKFAGAHSGIPTFVKGSSDEVRFSSPWTLRQNIARAAWMITTKLLFRPSFHNWYGFRNGLLRLYGAKIGQQVRIRPTAKIEIPWNIEIGDHAVIGDDAIIYSLGKITLGQRVVVSQYAHLCAGTHDFRYRSFPLLKPPITIQNDAWIAADAFVGPGVTVGAGAILGARSSAFHDLPAFQICIGNPAKAIKKRILIDDAQTDAPVKKHSPGQPLAHPAPASQPDKTAIDSEPIQT